jgi:alpha-1,6-mannosyltransferase
VRGAMTADMMRSVRNGVVLVLERFRLVRPHVALSLVGLVLVILAALGPSVHRSLGGVAWLALIGVWAGLAGVALRIAASGPHRAMLWIVLIGAALMRVPLVLEPPYLSSDMYRYVWDGRVQGNGINPYLHVPAAPELAHLRDSAVYPNINRADYAPTIYPPTAQIVFWLITRFGDGVLAMKLGFLVFEALAMVAIAGLLRHLALPPTHVVAFAWHPLLVWEVAGNAHVDIVMISLMLLSLWVALRDKILAAGSIGSLAVFVKPTALLLMPVYWRPWNWTLPLLLVGIGGLVYAPYLGAGRKVMGFLGGYVAEEELSSGGGFRYLKLMETLTGPLPHGAALYLGASALILSALALRIGFRADRSPAATVRAAALLLLAFLVLLTPHYPWYYLAIAPLLALQPRLVTPWVLATGGFLLYDVIEGDRMPSFALREGTLHLTVLAALAYDIRRVRRTVTTPKGDTA